MNVILYYRDDALLILRRSIHAALHRHHAVQLTFAVNTPFEAVLDDQRGQYTALVIASDYPHHVVGREEWVATLALNPETPLAVAVQTYVLDGAPYRALDVTLAPDVLQPALDRALSPQEFAAFIDYVGDLVLPRERTGYFLDSRILDILDIVQRQPEYKIAAKELSEKVHLSEGRLGHLFKAEVGIPLRRYLLWRRLMLASQIIALGQNYTFAAHETGFTDSAHLSRTFYAMFGLRISDMFGDRSQVRVVFYEE